MTDTRGRTRAAKKRAAVIIRQSMREEDEVIFHPRYEGEESNHQSETMATEETLDSINATQDRAQSDSRVDRLESDMGVVKGQMKNMDAKLDLLLATAMAKPSSSTPRKVPDSRPSSDDRLPPPRRLRRELNHDGYVDNMLREERFRPAHTEGKAQLASDPFTETLLPKPYMYVAREGHSTMKQKLDNRTTLSPMEYIQATLRLVNDPRACKQEDRDHILLHLQDVTHDIMERPWEGVRRWSQYVWDAVERGEFKWSDAQLILNKRLAMAMMAGGKQSHSSNTEHKGAKVEVICRVFNARGVAATAHITTRAV